MIGGQLRGDFGRKCRVTIPMEERQLQELSQTDVIVIVLRGEYD